MTHMEQGLSEPDKYGEAMLTYERDRLKAELAEAYAVLDACEWVLDEAEEYFDNRADCDCDQDGYIPNEEMLKLISVREALQKIRSMKK